MSNVKTWLVIALVLGMMVVDCSNGTTDNGDTWSYITDISQVNGNWRMSGSRTMTIKEYYAEGWHKDYGLSSVNDNSRGITAVNYSINLVQYIYNKNEKFNPDGFVLTVYKSGQAISVSLNDPLLHFDNTFSETAGIDKTVLVSYDGVDICEIWGIIVIDPSDTRMTTFFNNVNVNWKYDQVFTFNIDGLTTLFTGTETYIFSGGNVNDDAVWKYVTEQSIVDTYDFTVDDPARSLSYAYNNFQNVTKEDLEHNLSLVQINQNGTKIKIPPEVLAVYHDLETEAVIAVKQ